MNPFRFVAERRRWRHEVEDAESGERALGQRRQRARWGVANPLDPERRLGGEGLAMGVRGPLGESAAGGDRRARFGGARNSPVLVSQ
jgi:hypothetical protein